MTPISLPANVYVVQLSIFLLVALIMAISSRQQAIALIRLPVAKNTVRDINRLTAPAYMYERKGFLGYCAIRTGRTISNDRTHIYERNVGGDNSRVFSA